MADFLKKVASTLPRTPKAIVMVSAHWAQSHFAVTGGAQPELIYDYYGFPPHTYELKYPAPGAPALADQIVKTLSAMPSAGSKLGYLGSAGLFINYLATIFMTPLG